MAAATAALMMSACAATAPLEVGKETGANHESDQELYEAGFTNLRSFRSAVARVQTELYDGAWVVDQYGAVPTSMNCAGAVPGYGFDLDRSFTGGTFELSQAPDELVAWLRAEGWRAAGVSVRDTVDAGSGVTVVRAGGSPDGLVRLLYVSYYEATQSVLLNAESECFVGDQRRLTTMIFPDDSALIRPIYPETELPGEEPIFRFSLADGNAYNVLDEYSDE